MLMRESNDFITLFVKDYYVIIKRKTVRASPDSLKNIILLTHLIQ